MRLAPISLPYGVDLRRSASRAQAGRNARRARDACPFHRKLLRRRSKVLALSAAELGKLIEKEVETWGKGDRIPLRRHRQATRAGRFDSPPSRPNRAAPPSTHDAQRTRRIISRVAYISGVH